MTISRYTEDLKQALIDAGMITTVSSIENLDLGEAETKAIYNTFVYGGFGRNAGNVIRMVIRALKKGTVKTWHMDRFSKLNSTVEDLLDSEENIAVFFDGDESEAKKAAKKAAANSAIVLLD